MNQIKDPLGHFSNILDQQVREWNLRNKEEKTSQKYKHIITLSREYGTGGVHIGEQIAKNLNMSFWNQELIHTIAENSGMRESIISSLDAKAKSSLEDIIASLVLGSKATNKGYIKQLYQVIHTIEEHGNSLVIGRGAQFILNRQALKIRLISQLEKRIATIASRENINEKQAKDLLLKKDKERKEFHLENYRKDVTSPHHYDLIINTQELSSDLICSIITQAYNEKFKQTP